MLSVAAGEYDNWLEQALLANMEKEVLGPYVEEAFFNNPELNTWGVSKSDFSA